MGDTTSLFFGLSSLCCFLPLSPALFLAYVKKVKCEKERENSAASQGKGYRELFMSAYMWLFLQVSPRIPQKPL
jgi:hypothetical protein